MMKKAFLLIFIFFTITNCFANTWLSLPAITEQSIAFKNKKVDKNLLELENNKKKYAKEIDDFNKWLKEIEQKKASKNDAGQPASKDNSITQNYKKTTVPDSSTKKELHLIVGLIILLLLIIFAFKLVYYTLKQDEKDYSLKRLSPQEQKEKEEQERKERERRELKWREEQERRELKHREEQEQKQREYQERIKREKEAKDAKERSFFTKTPLTCFFSFLDVRHEEYNAIYQAYIYSHTTQSLKLKISNNAGETKEISICDCPEKYEILARNQSEYSNSGFDGLYGINKRAKEWENARSEFDFELKNKIIKALNDTIPYKKYNLSQPTDSQIKNLTYSLSQFKTSKLIITQINIPTAIDSVDVDLYTDSSNQIINNSSGNMEAPSATRQKKDNILDALEKLDKLTGLKQVKEEVKSLISLVQLDISRGVKTNQMLHMVFMGNPGTGKTTVAKILAKILFEMKVIKVNKTTTVTRADLVGEYVGETAPKTRSVIQKALGGILFIDEAYSLSGGGKEDYGAEAIQELLTAMVDYKDKLLVIVAGYTDEMEKFINMNPGLQSRFNTFIHFEDYNGPELLEIFTKMCKKDKFELDKDAKEKALEIFNNYYDMREALGKSFGNAREVERFLNKVKASHAKRLMQVAGYSTEKLNKLPKDEKNLLTLADIEAVETPFENNNCEE